MHKHLLGDEREQTVGEGVAFPKGQEKWKRYCTKSAKRALQSGLPAPFPPPLPAGAYGSAMFHSPKKRKTP